MNIEKFHSSTQETGKEDSSVSEEVPANAEKVIAEIHYALERAQETDPQQVQTLHREALQSDLGSSLERYEKKMYPTFEQIQAVIDAVVENIDKALTDPVDDEEKEFLEKERKYFSARMQSITYATFSYAESVAMFHNIKNSQFRMDAEEFTEKLGAIELTRRRRHNALLDTLRDLNRHVHMLKEDGYLDALAVTYWNPVSGIGKESPHMLFADEMLTNENRNVVRDWAIAADMYRSLIELGLMLEAQEEGNGQ